MKKSITGILHLFCCHLFFFLVFYLPLNISFANNSSSFIYSAPGSEQDWVFQAEVKGVKIFYRLSTCEEISVVYLKFDNTNKSSVRIAWKEVFATKQVPEEREGVQGEKQLLLAPGITSQSDCTEIKINECVILAYRALPAYKADIVKFKLRDIRVSNPA